MGVKNIVSTWKDLLQSNGFQNQVSLFDYSILDQPKPRAVILRPGSIQQTVNTYGDYARRFIVVNELHAFYDRAAPAADRLLDMIDEIDTIVIGNPNLGLSNIHTPIQVVSISPAAPIPRAEGQLNWFRAILNLVVEETETG